CLVVPGGPHGADLAAAQAGRYVVGDVGLVRDGLVCCLGSLQHLSGWGDGLADGAVAKAAQRVPNGIAPVEAEAARIVVVVAHACLRSSRSLAFCLARSMAARTRSMSCSA